MIILKKILNTQGKNCSSWDFAFGILTLNELITYNCYGNAVEQFFIIKCEI